MGELDTSKSYGQVYGVPGATFEQNGKFYNAKGFEVSQEVYEEAANVPADPVTQLKDALAQLGITEITAANKKQVLELLAQAVAESPEVQSEEPA